MSSTAFHGLHGSFKKGSSVIEIEEWDATVEVKVAEFVSNLTNGWTQVVIGPGKWKATISAYAVAGAPPFSVGDAFVANLLENATETTPGGGACVVQSIQEKVNVDDSKPVMFKASVVGNGVWTNWAT